MSKLFWTKIFPIFVVVVVLAGVLEWLAAGGYLSPNGLETGCIILVASSTVAMTIVVLAGAKNAKQLDDTGVSNGDGGRQEKSRRIRRLKIACLFVFVSLVLALKQNATPSLPIRIVLAAIAIFIIGALIKTITGIQKSMK
jgi:hypothetical protein